jgi:hypothetical protein
MRPIHSILVIVTTLTIPMVAAAQAGGGNGNGGSGGGNAHGSATAARTVGGDNVFTPTGTRKAPHFRHKKHSKPAPQDSQ